MKQHTIYHIDGSILHQGEAETFREFVEKHKMNLKGADLRGAELRNAQLRSANLEGANLCQVDLRGSNLEGSDLFCAKLFYADLEGAKFRFADLRGSNLEGANLRGAELEGANLEGAKNIPGHIFELTQEYKEKMISIPYQEYLELVKLKIKEKEKKKHGLTQGQLNEFKRLYHGEIFKALGYLYECAPDIEDDEVIEIIDIIEEK